MSKEFPITFNEWLANEGPGCDADPYERERTCRKCGEAITKDNEDERCPYSRCRHSSTFTGGY